MIKLSPILLAGVLLSASTAWAGQLHEAVRKGDLAAVKAQLSGGFDPDLKDESGTTPRKRLKQLEKEKDHLADPEKQDRYHSLKESVETRIADVNEFDKDGNTPLHLASAGGLTEIATFLLDHGAQVNAGMEKEHVAPLHLAVRAGMTATAKLLLDRGAFADGIRFESRTPLYEAVDRGKTEMLKLLLDRGAKVDLKFGPFEGTPLYIAVNAGNLEYVGLLLDHGADLNADVGGATPRGRAVELDKPEIVELLEAHFLKQVTDPRKAFDELVAKCRSTPGYLNYERHSLRRLVVKLAAQVKPPPAIPEEARGHFVEGSIIIKSVTRPYEASIAVRTLEEAVKIAPWWADAYYNLGIAQELTELPDREAERSFELYILSKPGEKEEREAHDRIYALSAKRKLLGH